MVENIRLSFFFLQFFAVMVTGPLPPCTRISNVRYLPQII